MWTSGARLKGATGAAEAIKGLGTLLAELDASGANDGALVGAGPNPWRAISASPLGEVEVVERRTPTVAEPPPQAMPRRN